MFKRIVLQVIVRYMESAESMTPQEIFALFDKNSNGFISLEDLKGVIKRLQFEGDQFKEEQEIEQLFDMITKKDGRKGKDQERGDNQIVQRIPQKKINYSEFLAATMDA